MRRGYTLAKAQERGAEINEESFQSLHATFPAVGNKSVIEKSHDAENGSKGRGVYANKGKSGTARKEAKAALDTRLHDACYLGDRPQVDELLEHRIREHGPDAGLLEARDRAGDTPLHMACLGKRAPIAQTLINMCPALANSSDKQGWTPLHYAATVGSFEIVAMLMDADALIQPDNEGNTPAHEAAQKSHEGCAMYLVEQAVNIDQARGNGAADPTRSGTVFSPNKQGETTLMIAAARGLHKLVHALIEHKAPVDMQSKNGWTALHFGANGGHDDVVRELIDQGGADRDVRCNDGDTPLHIACKKTEVQVVRILVNWGADCSPRYRGPAGVTVLHRCAINGSVEIAKLVLEGAHRKQGTLRMLVVARNEKGSTALELASKYSNREISRLLRDTIAAMIIQSRVRVMLDQINGQENDAASTMQRHWRGKNVRDENHRMQESEKIQERNSAKIIQRRWREHHGEETETQLLTAEASYGQGFDESHMKHQAANQSGRSESLDASGRHDDTVVSLEYGGHGLGDGGKEQSMLRLEPPPGEQSFGGDLSVIDAEGHAQHSMDMLVTGKDFENSLAKTIEAPEMSPGMNLSGFGGGGATPFSGHAQTEGGAEIDVGAVLSALEKLEHRALLRFDELGRSVTVIAARVSQLERQLDNHDNRGNLGAPQSKGIGRELGGSMRQSFNSSFRKPPSGAPTGRKARAMPGVPERPAPGADPAPAGSQSCTIN